MCIFNILDEISELPDCLVSSVFSMSQNEYEVSDTQPRESEGAENRQQARLTRSHGFWRIPQKVRWKPLVK